MTEQERRQLVVDEVRTWPKQIDARVLVERLDAFSKKLLSRVAPPTPEGKVDDGDQGRLDN